ncbi:porin family protein [bacterium]|nr:porin family protein [bacterium]
MKNALWLSVSLVGMLIGSSPVFGQKKEMSRFSHKGIKAMLGTGSFVVIPERNLEEGEGGLIGLGYGFTDRSTLWLNLTGAQHPQTDSTARHMDFGGLELNIQHRFETRARFQPYGKVGLGLYGLEEQGVDMSLIGAGVNLGLGLDFFFARHFGLGLELTYKKLDYFKQATKTPAGDLVSDIRPQLNGDTVGFMLTFTIQ